MTKRLATLGLIGALLVGCGGEGGDDTANEADANAAAANTVQAAQARGPIGDALAGSADHGVFVEALRATGLFETLQGAGTYTVFAPNDAAFDALPQDVRSGLTTPARREQSITLLSYHIVPGTVTAADLGRAIDQGEGRAELATVTGGNLTLSRDGEAILVGDGRGGQARITAADQAGANGVVHSIDTVLMPGR
jgi:uncharacterized surface protein with fasciclin (FAS1) repeats